MPLWDGAPSRSRMPVADKPAEWQGGHIAVGKNWRHWREVDDSPLTVSKFSGQPVLQEKENAWGLRASELCELTWNMIELDSGRIHVRRAKNGVDSTHPLTGKEMRALRQLRREICGSHLGTAASTRASG